MEIVVVIAIILVIGGIGVAVALHVRRQKYIASLTSRGWTFVDKPGVEAIHGLNCPPFGTGENRRVDDLIVGRTSAGAAFQAFEYDSSTFREGGYVATVRLPRSLPEYHHFPTARGRRGVLGEVVHQDEQYTVVAKDPHFGHAVLSVIAPTLDGYATPGQVGVVNLSLDHDQLVGVGAPKEAEQLAQFLEALATTAHALSAAPALAGYHGPPPPPRLSVYGHSHWEYRNRDDSLLNLVDHSTGGQNHSTESCLVSGHPALPFIALTHRWETTRTVTETDSEGRTRTRTVTDHHSEEIVEFHPQFRFAPFKVNRGLMGDRVRFEWHQFNEDYTVRCRSPKFASDVFHPRQLEYVMATRPLPFEYTEHHRIKISSGVDVERIAHMEYFLLGFFARVPNFVWEQLGHSQPPIPAALAAGRDAPLG